LVAAAAVVVVEPAVVVVVARVGAGGGWDAWGRPSPSPRVLHVRALPAGDVYLLTYLLDAVHPCVHLTILNCVTIVSADVRALTYSDRRVDR
jgi:hypothetical protein